MRKLTGRDKHEMTAEELEHIIRDGGRWVGAAADQAPGLGAGEA